MTFSVVITPFAKKQLSKLDYYTKKLIYGWILKKLENCSDPRLYGKPLKDELKGLWRYRVGDYRLIADIQDDKLVILMINIGHRKNVYKHLD